MSGDSERFTEIYRRHFDEIRRFIARRVAGGDPADLAQEVFVRALCAEGGEIRQPRSFLYQIAANLTLDHLRQGRRRIGAAEAAGVEFEWSRRLDETWQLDFNYTFNHTRITKNRADRALVGNELPYMPAHKANLALARERPELSARAALRYVGDAFTDERNTEVDANGYDWRQPAYAVVDLTLTKPLGDARLTFAVENLFDEHYLSGFFRRSAGRVVRGELAWRF